MYLAGNYCYRINAIAPRPLLVVHTKTNGQYFGQHYPCRRDFVVWITVLIGFSKRIQSVLVPLLSTKRLTNLESFLRDLSIGNYANTQRVKDPLIVIVN